MHECNEEIRPQFEKSRMTDEVGVDKNHFCRKPLCAHVLVHVRARECVYVQHHMGVLGFTIQPLEGHTWWEQLFNIYIKKKSSVSIKLLQFSLFVILCCLVTHQTGNEKKIRNENKAFKKFN